MTLPTFEGPLDLLLHLCQKHELDILDIPIGFVTEKYLEYLAVMQLINLDVASEYLVMAATLAHIKSKMLLPAPPPGQEDEAAGEEEDPREALIRRLLEYQKYKQAGEDLVARGVAGQDVFLRGMTIENAVHTGLPPLAQVPLFSLVEAFQTVLSKSKVKLSHDIVHERVTLADRINELVDVLRVRRRITFEDLFADIKTRFDLVITFLALLEMTRLRMTRLFQADFDSQIFIEFTAQVTADDAAEPGAVAAAEEGAEAAEAAATVEAALERGGPFARRESLANGAGEHFDAAPEAHPFDEASRFDTDRPQADHAPISPDVAFPMDEATNAFHTDPPAHDSGDEHEADGVFATAEHAGPSLDTTSGRSHTLPCPPPEEDATGAAGEAELGEDATCEANASDHDANDAVTNERTDGATGDEPEARAEANSSEDATEEAPARLGDENT